MPFRQSAPVIRNKHEITWSNLAQDASSIINITLAEGTASADVNVGTEVEIGHLVKWIYFEFHFSAQVITNPKVIHWSVEQSRTGQTAAIPSLYFQGNRSQIIKRGMEMLPKDVGTVFKRIFVVKIPRTMQRMRENQAFTFRYICSSSETINACGIVIYPEIS